MSTMTAPATISSSDLSPGERRGWLPDWAMIRAERLKLGKRRGLMATAALLSVVAITVVLGILVALHSSNPAKYRPAGGINHLANLSEALFRLNAIVAILIGATAGAGDLAAGFFRNLAVTGRSRLAMFLARIPGGLIILWPVIAVAFAVVAIGSVVFAGSLAAPSIGLLIKTGLWVELGTTVMFLLALGTSSVIGSRSTSLSILLALELVATPILSSLTGLPWLRQLWIGTSLQRLEPMGLLARGGTASKLLTIASGSAIAVIVVWCIGSVVAGARRTVTQDA
jgi:hypothetical protein